MNCPIAGGYIQRTLNLQPGNYKLTFSDATGVQVKIGNEVVTAPTVYITSQSMATRLKM